MKTELTITDITNMHAGRICIAGVNNELQTIRLLYQDRYMFKEWCLRDNQVIRPFSRIQVEVIKKNSKPPHTEDYLVNDENIAILGVVAPKDRQTLLQSMADPDVRSIFGTGIQHKEGEGYFVKSGEGIRSIGTVRVYAVSHFSNGLVDGRYDYRITFADNSRHWFRLKIVDLTFQAYVDHLREMSGNVEEVAKAIDRILAPKYSYFRVGLARGWGNYPDRCHLQITGVFTFPDYLCGKCFADFIPRGE